jgi:hypothetical protein
MSRFRPTLGINPSPPQAPIANHREPSSRSDFNIILHLQLHLHTFNLPPTAVSPHTAALSIHDPRPSNHPSCSLSLCIIIIIIINHTEHPHQPRECTPPNPASRPASPSSHPARPKPILSRAPFRSGAAIDRSLSLACTCRPVRACVLCACGTFPPRHARTLARSRKPCA